MITEKKIMQYLPYDVEIIIENYNNACWVLPLTVDNYVNYFDKRYKSNNIKSVKLILRPLLDLTKEIEHNGEKFVPIEDFKKAGYIFPLNEDNFYNLPYGIVNILLKWHFDIYGLIDAGLAIDINTINK